MRTTLAVLAAMTAACLVGFSYNKSAANDVDAVLAAIQNARAAIVDLDVTYTFNAITAAPNAVTLNTQRVQYLDGLIIVSKEWGTDPNQLFGAAAGYDGNIRWQRRGNEAFVSISSFPDEGGYPSNLFYMETEHGGFSALMGWFPCHEARFDKPSPNDLLSIEWWDDVVLRPEKETVGDAECFVIDYISNGEVRKSAWVDPARGYLPILQRSYSIQPLSLEFRIDEAVEAAPGVWIPTVGTRLVPARPDVPELSAVSEYRMEVQALSVNSGTLHAGDFDHTNWTPPGTTILDLDTDEMWLVSARDYSEAAEVVLARADVEPSQLSDDRSGSSPSAAWRIPFWIGLIVACGLASCWFVLRRTR